MIQLQDMRDSRETLHAESMTVRFQDVDAAGLVFFARFFDYFHDAYAGFLRARGAPIEGAIRDGSWIAPLRHAEADYIRPLRFADAISVVVAAVELADTEYTIGYRVVRGGEVVCVGRTVHVAVDRAGGGRMAVPEVLRRALAG